MADAPDVPAPDVVPDVPQPAPSTPKPARKKTAPKPKPVNVKVTVKSPKRSADGRGGARPRQAPKSAGIKSPIGDLSDPSVVAGKLPDSRFIPIGLLVLGSYLTWFGVHYWRDTAQKWPSDPVKAVLTGKGVPAPQPSPSARSVLAQNLVSATAVPTVSAGGAAGVASATGSQVADDALKYRGAGYVWGGNADKVGNWDCSSFVSYVLGHDLHLPLPGGHWGDPGFPPHSHGPTAVMYKLYGTTINRTDVKAGDLIVWNDHIAIATSASEAISAHSPSIGTTVVGLDAEIRAHSGLPSFRRI